MTFTVEWDIMQPDNNQIFSFSRGDLVSSEDILLTLRPFCSDSTLEVQPRLDVLHILEQVNNNFCNITKIGLHAENMLL